MVWMATAPYGLSGTGTHVFVCMRQLSLSAGPIARLWAWCLRPHDAHPRDCSRLQDGRQVSLALATPATWAMFERTAKSVLYVWLTGSTQTSISKPRSRQ